MILLNCIRWYSGSIQIVGFWNFHEPVFLRGPRDFQRSALPPKSCTHTIIYGKEKLLNKFLERQWFFSLLKSKFKEQTFKLKTAGLKPTVRLHWMFVLAVLRPVYTSNKPPKPVAKKINVKCLVLIRIKLQNKHAAWCQAHRQPLIWRSHHDTEGCFEIRQLNVGVWVGKVDFESFTFHRVLPSHLCGLLSGWWF